MGAMGKPFSDSVGRRASMLGGLFRLARPSDWIKNVFVLIPVPFALAAKGHFEPVPFVLGLFGFCLINSAVYTLNDLFDAEADRLHPRKRGRPIASGQVSTAAAVAQIVVLFLAGMGLSLATAEQGAVVLSLVYFAVNVVYSLGRSTSRCWTFSCFPPGL